MVDGGALEAVQSTTDINGFNMGRRGKPQEPVMANQLNKILSERVSDPHSVLNRLYFVFVLPLIFHLSPSSKRLPLLLRHVAKGLQVLEVLPPVLAHLDAQLQIHLLPKKFFQVRTRQRPHLLELAPCLLCCVVG